MATELATAYISLVPSMRGVQGAISKEFAPAATAADKAGKDSGKKFSSGFGATVKNVAASLGAVFAVSKVVDFVKTSVGAASDLGETINKTRVIFGDGAGAIEAWGDTAATNLGLSKGQALEAASGFGNMFSQLGFASSKAQEMSTSVVGLAADLGSFNNLPTAEVSEMLSAAFRGEYDSLQRLIPNINAARVEQEALAMTGKSAASELTAQEKAAATLAIVQKDGAAAAGDFARTSGGLANSSKILGAQLQDLKATMGAALIPVLEQMTAAGIAAFTWVKENPEAAKNLAIAIAGIATAVIAYKSASAGISFGKDVANSAQSIVSGAQKAVTSLKGVGAAGGALDGLKLRAMFAGDALKSVGGKASSGFARVGGLLASAASGAADMAKSMGQAAAAATRAGIAAAGAAIKTAAMRAVQIAVAAATGIWTAAQWLLNVALNANPVGLIIIAIAAVIGIIALLWTKCDWFRNGVMAIWNGIKVAVGAVVEWFQRSVLPILTNVWNWIKTGVGVLWTAFSTYWGFILGAVRTVIEWIVANVWPKAKAAFDLFKSGVEAVWRIVSTNFTNMRNIIGTVMEWVRNHIGSKIAAVREIFNTIRDKIGDVIDWFRGIKDKIAGALSSVGDKILAPFKSAFNAIANAWNNTVGKLNFKFPDGIPGVGGKGVSVPKIPTLAEGATIKPRRGGTLAILAEAGRSESVVDTGLMNQRLSEMNMTRHLAAAMAAAPAPSTTPTTLVVVDQDGQLIGRMRVEAGVAMDSLADELLYRNAG